MSISPEHGGRYKTIAVTFSDEEFARFKRWMDKQHDAGQTRSTAARQLILMSLSQLEAGSVPDAQQAPLEAVAAQIGASLGLSYLTSTLVALLVDKGTLSEKDIESLRDITLSSLEKAKAVDAIQNGMLWEEASLSVESLVDFSLQSEVGRT